MYILCIYRADTWQSLAFVARNRTRLRAHIEIACDGGHAWRLYDAGPRGGWCDGSPNAFDVIWRIPETAPVVF